jgi:hypothetical protein
MLPEMDVGELLRTICRMGITDERAAWELAQIALRESSADLTEILPSD